MQLIPAVMSEKIKKFYNGPGIWFVLSYVLMAGLATPLYRRIAPIAIVDYAVDTAVLGFSLPAYAFYIASGGPSQCPWLLALILWLFAIALSSNVREKGRALPVYIPLGILWALYIVGWVAHKMMAGAYT